MVKLFSREENRFVRDAKFPFRISPDESLLLGDLTCFLQFRKYHVLVAYALDENGRQIARNVDYVEIERKTLFPTDAKIQIRSEGGVLVLQSDKFARSVELLGDADGDEFGWLFEDNYFDLIPGEEKRVAVLGRHDKGVITAKAYYSDEMTALDWVR
jgi:hypothetical protein